MSVVGIVRCGNVSRPNVDNVARHGSDVARMSVTLDGEIGGPNHEIGEVSLDGIDRFDL